MNGLYDDKNEVIIIDEPDSNIQNEIWLKGIGKFLIPRLQIINT